MQVARLPLTDWFIFPAVQMKKIRACSVNVVELTANRMRANGHSWQAIAKHLKSHDVPLSAAILYLRNGELPYNPTEQIIEVVQ